MQIELGNFNGKPYMLIDSSTRLNLATGFGVYKANEFLRSLNTGLVIKFESYYQYAKLIKNINKKLQIN
ncbi:hypothetical protein [Clostridium sp.]|uniref:hypothetical protein n=1 Tax=Clostridium sp. TaxID=1506 RepID=UPI0034640028